jgi:hypothetical protein
LSAPYVLGFFDGHTHNARHLFHAEFLHGFAGFLLRTVLFATFAHSTDFALLVFDGGGVLQGLSGEDGGG